jgi:hypothetical protein
MMQIHEVAGRLSREWRLFAMHHTDAWSDLLTVPASAPARTPGVSADNPAPLPPELAGVQPVHDRVQNGWYIDRIGEPDPIQETVPMLIYRYAPRLDPDVEADVTRITREGTNDEILLLHRSGPYFTRGLRATIVPGTAMWVSVPRAREHMSAYKVARALEQLGYKSGRKGVAGVPVGSVPTKTWKRWIDNGWTWDQIEEKDPPSNDQYSKYNRAFRSIFYHGPAGPMYLGDKNGDIVFVYPDPKQVAKDVDKFGYLYQDLDRAIHALTRTAEAGPTMHSVQGFKDWLYTMTAHFGQMHEAKRPIPPAFAERAEVLFKDAVSGAKSDATTHIVSALRRGTFLSPEDFEGPLSTTSAATVRNRLQEAEAIYDILTSPFLNQYGVGAVAYYQEHGSLPPLHSTPTPMQDHYERFVKTLRHARDVYAKMLSGMDRIKWREIANETIKKTAAMLPDGWSENQHLTYYFDKMKEALHAPIQREVDGRVNEDAETDLEEAFKSARLALLANIQAFNSTAPYMRR